MSFLFLSVPLSPSLPTGTTRRRPTSVQHLTHPQPPAQWRRACAWTPTKDARRISKRPKGCNARFAHARARWVGGWMGGQTFELWASWRAGVVPCRHPHGPKWPKWTTSQQLAASARPTTRPGAAKTEPGLLHHHDAAGGAGPCGASQITQPAGQTDQPDRPRQPLPTDTLHHHHHHCLVLPPRSLHSHPLSLPPLPPLPTHTSSYSG